MVTPIKIEAFGGEVPAIDDRLLAPSAASSSINAWLFSGRIEPLHSLTPVYTMKNPDNRGFFRLPVGPTSIPYMASSYWLEFPDPTTRVIRSPIAGQVDDGRYYWADGVYPKMMTGDMIKTAQIPAPVQAPLTALPTGSLPPNTLIYYGITALTANGETTMSNEQSITTPATGNPGCTVNVNWSLTSTAGVTGYRVYRGTTPGGENHYLPVNDPNATSYVDNGTVAGTGGTPPTINTAGARALALGVPAPETAPGVTFSGGSGQNETASYVYTWVTSNGEEGPPSPPTSISGPNDATYTLTLTAPLAGDTANRNLATTRIYRTVVSAQGVATFFFVAEIPIGLLTYVDNRVTNSDAVIVNNEQLQSVYWTAPPADLQQLVSMPNGMVAGFRQNQVWFCEPYYPHAWPVTNVISVDANIVGLGVFNQSLIILTDGQPYCAIGNDPSSMSLFKIQPLEPCTSRLSIVNTPNGVLYSSPNGLIQITPMGAQNLTLQMITKDEWNMMLNLNSLAAGITAMGYHCYSLSEEGVFQTDSFDTNAFQQVSEFGTLFGAYISLIDPRISLTRLDPTPANVENVMTDIFSGEVFMLRDGVVYVVDLTKLVPYAPYTWRSKIFTMPYSTNLGAAKVYYTPPYVPTPPASTFTVYAGDAAQAAENSLPLRYSRPLVPSGQVFRLPSGFKALYWQFEVDGVAIIDAIHAAETPHQLREI